MGQRERGKYATKGCRPGVKHATAAGDLQLVIRGLPTETTELPKKLGGVQLFPLQCICQPVELQLHSERKPMKLYMEAGLIQSTWLIRVGSREKFDWLFLV